MFSLDDQSRVLLELMHLPNYTFHLTGSRFFGGARADSDWDFFVADTNNPYLRQDLTAMGFEKRSLTDYGDFLTTDVYHHRRASVHIQVVEDVNLKIHIQNVIKRWGLFVNLPKQSQQCIWNALYETVVNWLPG